MGANATDPSEDPVDRFRARLLRVIDRSGVSRSAFARKVGIDRSTLSQILSPASRRLPRVDTLVAIARNETVSIDWLVGLSQEGAYAPEILERDVELQPGGRSPSDERLAQWHREAHGYKIRYVPTTLPDLLRTDAVTDFEFAPAGTGVAELRRDANRERLALQRRPETDMEACSSLQGIELFARGQGI